MDPIPLIVTALSAAGGLIAQAVISEAAKDAYKRLRDRLLEKHSAQADVEMAVQAVEAQPDSEARQAMLAEELAKTQAAHDETLLRLTQTLVDAMKETSQGQQALSKYNVQISGGQVGVIGDNARITGGINFSDKK